MKHELPPILPPGSPLRIVLGYTLFGALWILFSDLLMAKLVPESFQGSVSIAKGWIFIVVTALLLYVLIGRRLSQLAQVSAEAQESETLFRSLFEQVAVGVAQIDSTTGRFVRINQYYCNIVGYSPEELESLSFQDITHPADLAADLENMRLMLAGEIHEFSVEKRYLRKDGEVVWVKLTVSRLWASAEHPVWHIAVAEDITERKRAEDALRESELNLKQAQEIARLGSWIYDLSGRISWSDGMYRIYGVSPETFTPTVESFIGLIHPDDRSSMQAWIEGGAAGEKYTELVFRTIWPDGTLRFVSGRGELIDKSDDRPAYMSGTAIDITERKVSEEKLQQSLKEMIALNDLVQQISAISTLDKLADASLAGISKIARPDLVLFFMRNGENLELLRSDPIDSPFRHYETPVHHVGDCLCGLAAASGKPLYSADIHTDTRCTWDECKKAGIRSLAALPLLVENEVLGVIALASGEEVDFEKQGSFLEAYSGQIALGLKNVKLIEKVLKHAGELEKEITERKQAEDNIRVYRDQLEVLVTERTRELEDAKQALMNIVEDLHQKTEELAAANERLKEIDQLKSMFIASMSHELRTPLNSVIGFSSILLNEWVGTINDEQKKCLTSILRSGKHLLSLINDVIDVSKIEAGMIDISREDFELAELLTEVEQTFAKEAQDHGLSLSVDRLDLAMHTDRRRLLQCILNLVSNGIKYSEQGGVSVAVRLDEQQGTVAIAVTDTGIGIGFKDQTRLFQAFSRIQSHLTATVLGTGLGLYLTRKVIVEILHGTISVASEPGQGSTFSMTIPCRI